MRKIVIQWAPVLLVVLFLMAPSTAAGQQSCPCPTQGDLAVILAEEFGLVTGEFTELDAIIALTLVDIYPGAMPDQLLPSETDGWIPDQPITNALFCEQLYYLVWAAAKNGSIEMDPEAAAAFIIAVANTCGITFPDPPPEPEEIPIDDGGGGPIRGD